MSDALRAPCSESQRYLAMVAFGSAYGGLMSNTVDTAWNCDDTGVLTTGSLLRSTTSAPAASPAVMPEMRPSTWPFITSRSDEHTSELQYVMRNSYPVFCL